AEHPAQSAANAAAPSPAKPRAPQRSADPDPKPCDESRALPPARPNRPKSRRRNGQERAAQLQLACTSAVWPWVGQAGRSSLQRPSLALCSVANAFQAALLVELGVDVRIGLFLGLARPRTAAAGTAPVFLVVLFFVLAVAIIAIIAVPIVAVVLVLVV